MRRALRAAAVVVGLSALAWTPPVAAAQTPPAPQFLLEFGGPGSGTGALGGNHQNEQLAVDADGNVWVADKSNNRVVKYDYNGEFLAEVRNAGAGRGSFNAPEGVAADAAGNVYVADTRNDRIVKLSSGGTPTAIFLAAAGSADPAAEPRNPTAMAVDSEGRLLVQAASGVIRLETANGRRLGRLVDETGSSVAVDKAGNVYTTELSTDARVLVKYRPNGTRVGEFSVPDLIEGLSRQNSVSVAVDPSGILHVGDFRGGVQRYSANGAYLDRYPVDGSLRPDGSPLDLYLTTGVATDCRGNVYVVNGDRNDANRISVVKFGDPAAEPPPCGPRVLPTGEISARINDVEVTQGTQPVRTFIANRFINGAQRPPDYDDKSVYGDTVPLVEKRDTVVRVFASLIAGPAGGIANVPATLQVTQRVGGSTITHDPILPIAQPSVLRAGAPATVGPLQRANPAGAYSFVLPAEWARGVVSLEARVNPAGIGCPSAECRNQASFRLNKIAFQRTALATVWPLALTIGGALPVYNGRRLDSPSGAFDLARVLTPLPINLFPWLGRIEVGDVTAANIRIVETSCFLGIEVGLLCSEEDKEADREARQGLIIERIERWADDNNVRDNVITAGLMSNANPVLPGAMRGQLFDEDSPALGYLTDARPTTVAHELQHALGRPHASTGCGAVGDQAGEAWPPDEQGFLQGVGLDPRRGSGGGRGPFAIQYPGANGGPAKWFDIMSYCRGTTDAWISPKGWRDAVAWGSPGGTSARALARRQTARVSQSGGVLRVAAVARADGSLSVSGVSPGAGPAEAGGAPTGWVLETRDAAGRQVLASTVMRAEVLPDGGGTALAGEVAAAGAAMVVVRREGGAITRRLRSANAPTVRLLSPRRGGRATRTLDVRWSASDADPGALTATVQYSADGGRRWRTQHIGTSKGRVRLSVAELAPSRRAKVRVRVDDGFSEDVAVSEAFTVSPAAPQARILEPRGGLRVRPDAPLILRGEATAAGRRLTGRSLRWFDGRRALGAGETLTVPRLDPGRHTLRLIARAAGRSSTRSVKVVVPAVRAQFLVLTAPRLVGARARSARLRVATTVPATLTVGGRRTAVGPKTRVVTVPVRRSSSPTSLPLTLRTAAGATRVNLTLARR